MADSTPSWNRSPEAYLNSLEPIGWRLGLERMRALSEELGRPQDGFRSVHVVGTNGKTSVTRMTEALLVAHGLSAGCCLSPHLKSWAERTTLAGREPSPEAFAAAVGRVADAVSRVESRAGGGNGPGGELEPGEKLTQFEVATAVAFVLLAEAGVEVAVIEAGLGGRLDATNVIDSELTVLTSVGLDHTEWLGDTELKIAAEKLAVLRPGSKLLTGQLTEPLQDLARQFAVDAGARLLPTPLSAPTPPPAEPVIGEFQRQNFALACAAAEQMLGTPLDPAKVRGVAEGLILPGRMERIERGGGEPALLLDVAHNPAAAIALARALSELEVGPIIACLAMLADKDAGSFIEALALTLDEVVCTELPAEALRDSGRPGATSHPAQSLAELVAARGVPAQVVTDPATALTIAGSRAAERGGAVLVVGSHYLVAIARDLAV